LQDQLLNVRSKISEQQTTIKQAELRLLFLAVLSLLLLSYQLFADLIHFFFSCKHAEDESLKLSKGLNASSKDYDEKSKNYERIKKNFDKIKASCSHNAHSDFIGKVKIRLKL
jgi:hypothetical protein